MLHAQREVNFSETLKSNQDLHLEFKFANEIKVVHGNSNEIKINATVNIDDGDGNEFYSLKSKSLGSEMVVESDFGKYFKSKRKKFRDRDGNVTINYGGDCSTTEIDYVVYVPKNCNLYIKSISGSVSSDDFKGELQTDLISGSVTIKNYEGELYLKTISGALDVTVNKAQLSAKSLTGMIYSDIEFKTDTSRKHYNHSHNKVDKQINGGTKALEMETISGNIYIRKG